MTNTSKGPVKNGSPRGSICSMTEKELTRRSDELARRRQELPWVRIDKDYRFETDDGSASLADLFRGRSQLLVYHFMFGPGLHGGMPVLLRDRGRIQRLCRAPGQPRRDALGGVAAPLAKLQAYKRRMGWTFPWASSFGGDFNSDFNVSITEEQQRAGPSNTTTSAAAMPLRGGGARRAVARVRGHLTGTDVPTYARERPGMSSFVLEDGVVYHAYSTYARGLDGLWGMYQWLDRAPRGRNETGLWLRRHDEYDLRPKLAGRFRMASERTSQRTFLPSLRCSSPPARHNVIWCASMSAMSAMPMPGGWTMSMAWMRMPGQSWPGAAATFLGMWVVMMVAMMLPSLVPMLSRYRQAVGRRRREAARSADRAPGPGLLLVWTVFGMVVFPLGAALASLEMREPALARACPWWPDWSSHRRSPPVLLLEGAPPCRLPSDARVLPRAAGRRRHGLAARPTPGPTVAMLRRPDRDPPCSGSWTLEPCSGG